MSEQRLSEERARRLEELRAKYRKPLPRPLTWEDINCWHWKEHIGYTCHEDDYWRVHQGEVELVNGEVVLVWTIEEMWLPCRSELLDHCPPLDTPPDDYIRAYSVPLA